MKRSSGFTLVELLTALVIHSFFILILGGTFYTLLSFGSQSQFIMTARERGQRVINYIDSRVRHVGLGLWKLGSTNEIREALRPLTESGLPLGRSDMKFPIMITYEDRDGINKDEIDGELRIDGDKIYGNVLTLLYAERETDTDSNGAVLGVFRSGIDVPEPHDDMALMTLINKLDSDDFWIKFFTERCPNVLYTESGSNETKPSLGIYEEYRYKKASDDVRTAATKTLNRYSHDASTKIDLIAAYPQVTDYIMDYPLLYKYLHNRGGNFGEFYYSAFGEKKGNNDPVESHDIRAWGVSRGAGAPFTVDKYDNKTSNKRLVKLPALSSDTKIPDGDELLYLKSIRVYATEPTTYDKANGQPFRNLKIIKLNGEKWGQANPYQQGILELYAELDISTNILSVWVLSMGGHDNKAHERPADWPDKARPEEWNKSDYKNFVTYVSKGTWKLINLPDGFNWN